MKLKSRQIVTLIVFSICAIIAIFGCVSHKVKMFADEINDYKEYYSDIDDTNDLENNYETSDDTKYRIVNYQEYLKFCDNYNITKDLYENTNTKYMIVCVKPYSIGMENHEYKIITENQTISINDKCKWGATGDRYGIFLCIPLNNDENNLNYTKKYVTNKEN